MKDILTVIGWFCLVAITGYIWGAVTTLASNDVKVRRVCDLCFRNIKEWNKVYQRNQKTPPKGQDLNG